MGMLVAGVAALAVMGPVTPRSIWLSVESSRWLPVPTGTVWLAVPKAKALPSGVAPLGPSRLVLSQTVLRPIANPIAVVAPALALPSGPVETPAPAVKSADASTPKSPPSPKASEADKAPPPSLPSQHTAEAEPTKAKAAEAERSRPQPQELTVTRTEPQVVSIGA